jgi:predicted DNA-binding transcriptional regulator AlpA
MKRNKGKEATTVQTATAVVEAPRATALARERWLALQSVAKRIGFSVKTVRRLMLAGRFPGRQKVLGQWRIPEVDVERFLAEERGRCA